jgi:TPR repeat protein
MVSTLSNRAIAKASSLSIAVAALAISISPIALAADLDIPRLQAQAERGSVHEEIALAAAYMVGRGVQRDEKQAAFWYEKAANSGNPGAQEQIGFFYSAGIGVEKDPVRAAAWFARAVAGGSISAKVNLGVDYAWGLGVRKDPAFAVKLFREAAEKGNGTGACYLGVSYYFGIGVDKDVNEAMHWFEVGSKLHNPQAQFDLAFALLQDASGRNAQRVLKLLQESAAGGYVAAKHQLALEMIQHPNFASITSGKSAVALLEEASAQGYWKSSIVLGILYRDGRGQPKDNDAAYYHFRIATLQGGQRAANLLANDIQVLRSRLDDAKALDLDSTAIAWVGKHRDAIEFLGAPGRNEGSFPTLAIAYPEAGTHAGKPIPLSLLDEGLSADKSFLR